MAGVGIDSAGRAADITFPVRRMVDTVVTVGQHTPVTADQDRLRMGDMAARARQRTAATPERDPRHTPNTGVLRSTEPRRRMEHQLLMERQRREAM